MWFLDSCGSTPRLNGSMEVEPTVSPLTKDWIKNETIKMKSKVSSIDTDSTMLNVSASGGLSRNHWSSSIDLSVHDFQNAILLTWSSSPA